ncbi:MAG: MBL fold metallo-hydrolase [Deltaproteobacteria bacterium]|nr:MBL fold metallo-hydrolase [Deltaproteobacteria bacterium]
MKITTPGKITEGLYLLGNVAYPSYLINTAEPVMFDAGVSPMGPYYMKDLGSILDTPCLQHMFFTHSHYDHTGAYGYMKKCFPALTAGAHPRTKEVMQSSSAVNTMTMLSDIARDMFQDKSPDTAFVPPEVTVSLKEGAILELGHGIRATVIETPGHTRDSISFFLEPMDAIIPGEALGVIHLGGEISPEFLADFQAYHDSAKRIIDTRPNMILMPHGSSLTHEDAQAFIDGAIPAALSWMEMISKSLKESGGDIDRSTDELFSRIYDPSVIGQEVNAFRINLRAKVACVSRFTSGGNHQI